MPRALEALLDFIRTVLSWVWRQAIDFVHDQPWAAALAALAVARMFGTVVETGWRGVRFSFGKVKGELEPGFHWLGPIVHHVRKVRVRSVSLDLPPQRIVTRDGLVFDVDADAVYHVSDPTLAVVQIDDVHRGCRLVIPLVISSLLRERDAAALADRSQLDGELAARVQSRVERWGVAIEHAGLQSIAPTRETLRITQLRLRCEERARVYAGLRNQGISAAGVLGLLGASTRLVEKSVVRRRGYRRRLALGRRFGSLVKPELPPLAVGDSVQANWLEMGKFYPAKVTKIDGEQVHVKYEDGADEEVHIRHIRRVMPKP